LPSVSERTQVLIALEALPIRKPPITDLEAIDLYDEALAIVVPDKQESWQKIIGEMRCQSVKSAPKDEPLSRNCLRACLSKGDLDHARQVCFLASSSLTLAICLLWIYDSKIIANIYLGCH
jgi:N-terminal acetyltransferase B complex non-catalytic subunit